MARIQSRDLLNGLLVLILVVVAALVAQKKGYLGGQVTHTEEGILVQAPTFGERIDQAVARAATTTLSTEARKDVEEAIDSKEKKGRIALDRPGSVKGLPDGAEVVSLFENPDIRAALEKNDEARVARALRETGVRVVALHWKAAPSVDRGATVVSRLFHHDELTYFQLLRITDELFIYKVRGAPVAFANSAAAMGIDAIRRLLAGENPPPVIPPLESTDGPWDLIASVRGQGRELAIGLAKNKDFPVTIFELARDLERGHRRYMEWYGLPPMKYHVKNLALELHRITEKAAVEPRDEASLTALWEMGIDGVILRDYANKQAGIFPGSVAYTRSYRDPITFFRKAASFHNMDKDRPWEDRDVALELVRTIHFKEVPGTGVVQLVRGQPLIPIEAVTLPNVRASILGTASWYLTNLQPDGRVLYKFWPAENRESNEYNLVRHTLATWNLVMAWKLDPRPEYLEGARRAQDFTNRWIQKEGEMAYHTFENNTKLGSVVVGLLGMIELAQATGDHSNDEIMKEFGRFVKFMQEPTGKFKGYHVEEDHPYYDMENDIVPGEAALSLVFLARYFKDPSWLEPLPSYWTYYEPWFRERAAKIRTDAPWPAHVYDNETRLELVQFGPWTVMAANAYHQETGDAKVARLGLDIGRWMIETYQWTTEKSPYADYVGGYYKLPGELPAMQAFCYAEGTAAAYQLALRFAPEEAPFFEKSTREATRFAFQMQFNPLNTYAFSRPWQVMGGIRYALNETKVRIDYVHHAMSAMYQYLDAAARDPALPEAVRAGYTAPPNLLATPGGEMPEKGVMPEATAVVVPGAPLESIVPSAGPDRSTSSAPKGMEALETLRDGAEATSEE